MCSAQGLSPPHILIFLFLPALLLSPVLSILPFLSVACNDLVASGRDRTPNALVQVAVIDLHKQQLVSCACTEIVEVRQHTHMHHPLCLSTTFDVSDFAVSLGHWVFVGVLSIAVRPASPPLLSDSSNWNRQ